MIYIAGGFVDKIWVCKVEIIHNFQPLVFRASR